MASPALRLVSPNDAESWAAYHRIRRTVLFENRGALAQYDPDRPDERKSGNHPKLLVRDGTYVGVVRVDVAGDTAYLRRVAIDLPWQRQGLGRALLGLAERFAREAGIKRVESDVAADAVSFYEKCGYRVLAPRAGAAPSVPMYKDLPPTVEGGSEP